MTDYGMILEVLKSQNTRKKRKWDWDKIQFEEITKNKNQPEINLPDDDISFIFTRNGRLRGISNYKQ